MAQSLKPKRYPINSTTMNQTVTFFEKSVYGKTLIYPKCDRANVFAGLTATKTFTLGQLSLIQGLGYTVELIALPS